MSVDLMKNFVNNIIERCDNKQVWYRPLNLNKAGI